MYTAKEYTDAETELDRLKRERFDLALQISVAYRRLRAMRKRGITPSAVTAKTGANSLDDAYKYKNYEDMTAEEQVKFNT